MKLVLVSGLSGSGKSIALEALEDMGFYCIDNLPASLLSHFAKGLIEPRGESSYEHAAVGIDARNYPADFGQVTKILDQFGKQGLECEVLFLEADDSTLLKRFSETRRKHPLTRPGVSLAEAIRNERRLLALIRERADLHIDTSRTNIHELRDLVRERVAKRTHPSLSLLFLSFGYKGGIPADADFIFDVRCLPNPHWEPRLRQSTGLDEDVKEFLGEQSLVLQMVEDLKDLIGKWIPHFEDENRSYMTIAIGCTGGQHRSVYIAECLAEHFQQRRDNVLVRHREIR